MFTSRTLTCIELMKLSIDSYKGNQHHYSLCFLVSFVFGKVIFDIIAVERQLRTIHTGEYKVNCWYLLHAYKKIIDYHIKTLNNKLENFKVVGK